MSNDNWDKDKQADEKEGFKDEFSSVEKVLSVIKPMEDIERLRASDRAKIDALFNGKRPYTDDECEKHGIVINVNWGEGKRIMRDAMNQLNQALLHPGILFNCTLEAGQMDKRDEWSQKFTANIHKPITRGESGLKHYYVIKNRNATIAMHGIGALLWPNDFRWMPRFVGLEDLLIPTETYCDMGNCRYFAVNQYLVPGELLDIMEGDKVKPGWDKKMIEKILKAMKGVYSEGVPPTWRDQPEAMTNIWKENRGFYYTDATPKIRVRWFFWQQIDEPKKWFRKMILREAYSDVKPSDGFLFEEKEPFAENIHEILNLQYGDNNYVAPLKYHSVRGLGVDLYAPIETLNRLRCEFVQSVFEHLKMYFRIQDPSDRDRLKQIVLSQYGVLPEGLQIVPRADRQEIDSNLVQEAMGQLGDIMQTNASSYVANPEDSADSKQRTATEAQIKANQANVMVSAMIVSLYLQESFYYHEVVRRFCKRGSRDPEVQEFQKACKADGIPEEYIYDAECWRVVPERVLGGGDKTQAQQQAMALWQNRLAFDPSVQPTLGRLVWGTLLDDFDKANLLVPVSKPQSTSGTIAAENVFGTLMTGNQTATRQGIDFDGYVMTLLRMMGAVVQRVMQQGGVTTLDELIGLSTVGQNIQQHIGIISADPKQKQLVKRMSDGLAQIINLVKGIAQRTMQQKSAQQKQAQPDPKAAASAQGAILMAKTKASIAQSAAALKQKQKQVDFALDQQRQNLQLASEMQRENARHHMEIAHENANQVLQMLNEVRQMLMQAQSAPEDGGMDEAA